MRKSVGLHEIELDEGETVQKIQKKWKIFADDYHFFDMAQQFYEAAGLEVTYEELGYEDACYWAEFTLVGRTT